MKRFIFFTPIFLLLCLTAQSVASTDQISYCHHNCKVTKPGYTLIKSAEGYSPFIYRDSAGVPTVGFGHALKPGEKIDTPLMGDQALALLQKDLDERVQVLNELIEIPLTEDQFDALTSFAYNVGLINLKHSTLLKKVNAGQHQQVHPQFLLWDHAGGKVLPGLRVRREAEANLYDLGIRQ